MCVTPKVVVSWLLLIESLCPVLVHSEHINIIFDYTPKSSKYFHFITIDSHSAKGNTDTIWRDNLWVNIGANLSPCLNTKPCLLSLCTNKLYEIWRIWTQAQFHTHLYEELTLTILTFFLNYLWIYLTLYSGTITHRTTFLIL